MKKVCVLALAILILLFAACGQRSASEGNPHGTLYKMSEEHYAVGKEALAVAEAFLTAKISEAEALDRMEKIEQKRLDLPLTVESDPLSKGNDTVNLYVESIYLQFSANSGDETQRPSLIKMYKRLAEVLGVEPVKELVDK